MDALSHGTHFLGKNISHRLNTQLGTLTVMQQEGAKLGRITLSLSKPSHKPWKELLRLHKYKH